MNFGRRSAVAAALMVVVGCASKTTTPPPAGSLVVTASPATAAANGVSAVAVTVAGTATAPIRVTTTRGSFTGGANAVTVTALPASLTITSCDAAALSACAGTAIIQAVDANLATGAASVLFTAAPGTTPGGGDNSGTAGSITITAVASSARIPADGQASAAVTATVVDSSQKPVSGRTVSFTQGGSGATLRAATAITDAAGLATVVLVSDAAGGSATVTATEVASGASSKVTIDMPKLGQINLAKQQYQVQGVRYSGYQESNQLTFQLLDTGGAAYPAGLAVAFSHQALGGSYVGTAASCSTGVPSICTATGTTDASGQVVITLASGLSAGVVTVTASATAGGQNGSGSAANIAIVGAKGSGAHITLDCTPKNIPVLSNNDCNYSHYVGTGNIVTCTATFADRFNNVLGVATQATFASEAGAAGPPASTVQYDPSKPPSGQTNLGAATNFINLTGGTLPADVTPFTGEFSLQYQDACGTKTHNPRDGLVTVIVTANGEEGFVDLNGNGVFDAGEPFIDMGEPFVDANDNGQWDSGESFVDLNGNKQYDPPNGKWDANTVIWAETRILFTDQPRVQQVNGQEQFSRVYPSVIAATAQPTATPPAAFSLLGPVGGGTPQPFTVSMMDGNFNAVAPSALFAVGSVGTAAASIRTTQLPPSSDTLGGITLTQQYCDKASAPSTCSNTCQTSPCYVVTNVGACDLPARATCSGFRYGSQVQAEATGTCAAVVRDTIQGTSTLNGVAKTVTASVGCDPCPGGACGSGTSTGSQYTVSIVTSAPRLAADGVSTARITATVTSNNVVQQNRLVTFTQSSAAGSSVTFTSAAQGATNAFGQAFVDIKSTAPGGVVKIRATDDASQSYAEVDVEMPQLGQVNLLSQQYQVQGVRYSGYQETNSLTFQLLDTAGRPYPQGLTVSFAHQSLAGSYLGASDNCTGVPSMCTASGTTNVAGQVTVLLTSGQQAGLVSVTGTATAGQLTATGVAKNLAIVGAKANGAHITLDCTPRNVPGLVDSDCNFSHSGPTIQCVMTLADRFNNVLGIPTLVTFFSEAGTAGPPATTPAYNPTSPPTGQTSLGSAVDFINVAGGKLPIYLDLEQTDAQGAFLNLYPGEYAVKFRDACGDRWHNPRQGLSTVIALANGEEGFVDLNGNGVYDQDQNEPFIDMGEPFVDANDNGKYDLGEAFWDSNRNGSYDGPNGVWDKDTVVWAETRVLYTGLPIVSAGPTVTNRAGIAAGLIANGATQQFSRFLGNAPNFPGTTVVPNFAVNVTTGPGTQFWSWVDEDLNLNPPAPTVTTYSVGTAGSGVVNVKLTTADKYADNLGILFTQQYCDKPADQNPTSCSNVCQTKPCYVVPNVGGCNLSSRTACTGFPYGSSSTAAITGSCSVTAGETVYGIATVQPWGPAMVPISGTCTK